MRSRRSPAIVAEPAAPPTPEPDLPLTWRHVLRFWTPLVLTSMLVTLSGPLLNVAVGRGADAKLDFAGYWVAFTVMLFVESACLAVQQVTVALAGMQEGLRRLAVSAALLGLGASLVLLVVAQTALGGVVFQRLIPTSGRVSELARAVLTLLAPVPLLTAVRDVALGMAIREKGTSLVALSTTVRIVVLSCGVGLAAALSTGSGARAGAWAFLSGRVAETAFVLAATLPSWRAWLGRPAPGAARLSYGGILRVAAPLAVAALVWTSVRPVVNAVLGRLAGSDLAQASFGVVLPILMVTCSPLWGLHQVSLVLPRDRPELRRVIRFAAGAASVFTLGIGLLTVTPLGLLALRLGFDLSAEMETAVAPALPWIALVPFLLSTRAIAQGLLTRAKRTGALLIVAPVKILLMLLVGLAAAGRYPHANGATLAVLLVIGGDLLDAAIVAGLACRLVAGGRVFGEPAAAARGARGGGTVESFPRPALGEPV